MGFLNSTMPPESPCLIPNHAQFLAHLDIPLTCNSSNTTQGLQWTWMHTTKTLIFSPIVFFAIFGNLLALFAFCSRYSQMKSPTHFFIANLALADFLVGLLCLPFLAISSVTGEWSFGPKFCFAYVIMHFWFCSCSIYSTTAICVERYIGVRYPLKHKEIMSIPRVCGIILFIWIYGGVITAASVFLWPEDEVVDPESESDPDCQSEASPSCKSNTRTGHVIFSTVFIMYIPLLLMVLLYSRIYMIATKHLKILRDSGSGRMSRTRGTRFTRKTGLDPDSGVSSTATVITMDSISRDVDKLEVEEDLPELSSAGAQNDKKMTPKWFPSMRRMQLPLTMHEPSPHDSTERLVKATSSKRHIHLAKKLVFLVGILLLSYVPYYTIILIRAEKPEWDSKQLFNILKWMRYLNSAINPFLYAFAVPAYRKAFIHIVCNKKLFN